MFSIIKSIFSSKKAVTNSYDNVNTTISELFNRNNVSSKEEYLRKCYFEIPSDANAMLDEISRQYGVTSDSIDLFIEFSCLFVCNIECHHNLKNLFGNKVNFDMNDILIECGNSIASAIYNGDYDVDDRCLQIDFRNMYNDRTNIVEKRAGGLSLGYYKDNFIRKIFHDMNIDKGEKVNINEIVMRHIMNHNNKLNGYK